MARQSPNGRPIVGKRLNDTVALVSKGVCPPRGVYELHSAPSPEAMVTPPERGGARPEFGSQGSCPDSGNTAARARDYLRRIG